jgi:hypothetical protein
MTTTLKLSNDFHSTTATLRPAQGRISARAWRHAMRRLCPSQGCTCGAVRGEQPGLHGAEIHEQSDGSRRVEVVS